MEHDKSMKSKEGIEMLEQVRRICSPLPEAEEIIDGFGHTVFRVNGKSFVRLGESEGDGAGLSFKSDRETQELLLQQEGFFKTPYIGHHGWVSVKHPQDWGILGDLLKEAYLRAAPKRLAKLFTP